MLTAKLRDLRRKHAADLEGFDDELEALKAEIRELKAGKKKGDPPPPPKGDPPKGDPPKGEDEEEEEDDDDDESIYD
jgi:hypothetical protein